MTEHICSKCQETKECEPIYLSGKGDLAMIRGRHRFKLGMVTIGWTCDSCWDSFFLRYEELQKRYDSLVDEGVHPAMANRIVTVESNRSSDDECSNDSEAD